MRAVGTLTRTGTAAPPDPDRLVARDVSWRELRHALYTRLATQDIEPEVRLVAESFVAAIDARIAPVPPSQEEQTAFFASHESSLDEVADKVGRLLGASGPVKRIRGEAYVGWRVPLLATAGQPLFVRLYLSLAGTGLNLPGAPDALIAAPERDSDGTLEPAASDAAQAAGFLKTKDLDRYWLHRRLWPVEGLVADDVAREIADALTKTGLLVGGGTDARSDPPVT